MANRRNCREEKGASEIILKKKLTKQQILQLNF
jgi:hypothetical protein